MAPIDTGKRTTRQAVADPAIDAPAKVIGKLHHQAEAKAEAAAKGRTPKPDGKCRRRVAASFSPKRIFQLRPIEWLQEKGAVAIAPTKTAAADFFVVAADANAVYLDQGAPNRRAIRSATPDEMDRRVFPAGSVGAKVQAARDFARTTGKRAVICALADAPAALRGENGTTICVDAADIRFH